MHIYHNQHGRLPPAVVYGSDGRPLYSWRVLLLPFMEEEALYQEFKLDEPWDSAQNIQLLHRMPRLFAAPPAKAGKAPPYHTFIHVFVGPGTAFEGVEGLRLAADFPDGIENTILMVEGGHPVPWTKPEDLAYAPDQPLPELATLFKAGFRTVLADRSIRFVRKETSEATIRAAITRNGGDTLGPDWGD